MDDVKQERVVDLFRYIPDFLRDLREFREIYMAEEPEVKKMYKEMDLLWTDSFIQEASIKGIKRLESIAGLKPYPEDTLEERRSAVLMQWNQQLPYTMERLRERLTSVVGGSAFRIWMKSAEYMLEIQVIDQTIRVLRILKEMLENMIPANIILDFSGCYPMEVAAPIEYDNTIKIRAEYYPRYNLAYLKLDGHWALDGSKRLNGYDGNVLLDFYPVRLNTSFDLRIDSQTESGSISSCVKVSVQPETRAKGIVWMEVEQKAIAEILTRIKTSVVQKTVMEVSVTTDNRLNGQWALDGARKLNAGRRTV